MLPSIYLESILTVAFPFVLIFPFFYYLLSFKKRTKEEKSLAQKKVVLAFLIALYSFQPSILSNLIELSVCKEFYFGFFLQAYLIENCNSDFYLNFYYYFVLPLLIIFSALIPIVIMIYFYIKKRKGLLFDQSVSQKIGFLLIGFKKENFYW